IPCQLFQAHRTARNQRPVWRQQHARDEASAHRLRPAGRPATPAPPGHRRGNHVQDRLRNQGARRFSLGLIAPPTSGNPCFQAFSPRDSFWTACRRTLFLPTDDRKRLPALGGTLTDCCRRRARIAGVIGIACEQRRRIFMKSILVGSSALGVALAAAISLPAMAQAVPISQEACEALMGLELPVDGIELETTGGTVDATEWVQSDSNGTYCKVLGSIDPVDSEAWPIKWQANLPSDWNGKA